MANTIDLFDTRNLIAALRQMFPVKTFLKDNFFPDTSVHNTRNIDIDIKKGKRRIPLYVKREAEGTMVERIGFVTRNYTPPYVKPKMVTTATDFLKRDESRTIYETQEGPLARAQRRLGEDLATMDEMITRAEEKQASQLLQGGILTLQGDGFVDTIDFEVPASHKPVLSGADLWDASTGVPLEDLRTEKRRIKKSSGLSATDVIMGEAAINAFLANPSVTSQLDTRRIDLGLIIPEERANGVTFYGRIRDVAMDLWGYDEWYVDPITGVETEMVDPKKVIIATRGAMTKTHYGAIEDLKANFAMARFSKSWQEDDPSAQLVMVQSAPLLALHQVDAFVILTVLA